MNIMSMFILFSTYLISKTYVIENCLIYSLFEIKCLICSPGFMLENFRCDGKLNFNCLPSLINSNTSNTLNNSETSNTSNTLNNSETSNTSNTLNNSETSNISNTLNNSEISNTSNTFNNSEISNTSNTFNNSEISNTSNTFNNSEISNTSNTFNNSEISNTSNTFNNSEISNTKNLCKRFEDNFCIECNIGYDLYLGKCVCYGSENISRNICCKSNNCIENNFVTLINKCGCKKCLDGFYNFNHECVENFPHECINYIQTENLYTNIPESLCISSIKSLKVYAIDLCQQEYPLIYKNESLFNNDYIVFSLNKISNYEYVGISNFYKNFTINNCLRENKFIIYTSLSMNTNITESLNELRYFPNFNASLDDIELFSYIVSKYVNKGNIISFSNDLNIKKYCLNVEDIYVDFKTEICSNNQLCNDENFIQSNILTFINKSCYRCKDDEFIYIDDFRECYYVLMKDRKSRENIIFLTTIIIISLTCIFSIGSFVSCFKSDYNSKWKWKNWNNVFLELLDLIASIIILFTTLFSSKSIFYSYFIICFIQFPIFFIGGLLHYIVSRGGKFFESYNSHHRMILKMIIFLPYIIIYVISCVLNILATRKNQGPEFIDNILEKYNLGVSDNYKPSCKLIFDTIDFFNNIAFLVIKIIIARNSSLTYSNILSIVFSLIMIVKDAFVIIMDYSSRDKIDGEIPAPSHEKIPIKTI